MNNPVAFFVKVLVAGNGFALFFFGIALSSVRGKRSLHYWGSAFFASIGLSFILAAAESMGLYRYFPHFILVNYFFLALSGPLLYNYFIRLVDGSRVFYPRDALLFLYPLFFAVSFLPFYALGGDEKIAVLSAFMKGNEREYWRLFLVCQTADGWVAFCALLFLFNGLRERRNNPVFPRYTLWLSALVALCASLHLSAVVLSVQSGALFLFLSLSMLALSLYTFRNSGNFAHAPQASGTSGYRHSKIENLNLDGERRKLERLMEEDKLYMNENLSLADVSDRLGLGVHQLSEFLNAELKTTFKAYVNGYRLREAQRLLLESPDDSILEIALNSGFNSKSTFNKFFRDKTGMTPTEYRSSLKS